ncbi:MAG TPA: hypothetical protein VJN18_28410 [Polyangiaceae bacterium]|nr:hypothetical protein [Polyangiaceae bacterium]
MARPLWSICITLAISITLLGGCERRQRAREREALEARAKAQARAREAARHAALPLPEEPPFEMLRVPDSGLPCKVDDVLAAKCRRCHSIPTRHGAPFVFLTWQDMQQERAGQRLPALIARAVRSNFMPYRIAANPPVLPLTDEEKQIILDWVDAGAPRENCDPNAPPNKKVARPIKSAQQPPPTQAQPSDGALPSR